jgi:serine/threonine protein kinase/tetratricopeptide (TPR) repeat protein
MTCCSNSDQLALLLDERLDEAEQALIMDHVEACPRCQKNLEELTGGKLALEWGPPAGPLDASGCITTDLRIARGSLAGLGGWSAASSEERGGEIPWPEVPGYDIQEELGRGGMGVVYKALQRPLNRLVALKMIRAGSQARQKDLGRFRIEAEAMARLRHPNVVQIHDIGEVAGLPFVSLELLEGGSLEVRLAGSPQPSPRAAELVVTLTRAVHAAHQVGIVHRDLKPSNILFAQDGTPKIADFGLAKRLEEEGGHTESGQVMGSPSYISPEQASGRNREVGPAADVYALGAILYYMLIGQPPFRGTTAVETMMQVLHEEPVPPSRLQPKVPRDLETICLKCLDKVPQRRYASAEDLGDDLVRYLAGEPIRARPTPPWEIGLKWVRRRPTAATLLAIGTATLLGLAGYGLWRDRRDDERVARLRLAGAHALNEAREALVRGDWDKGKLILSTLTPKIEEERRLADLGAQVASLLEQTNRELAERAARGEAVSRYHQFLRRRDEAFVQAVHFSGLDLPDDPEATRSSARAALGVFAAEDHEGTWAMNPLPTSLTPQERDDMAARYYELMLILADAVAQPRPGEDPRHQAQKAIRILDRAAEMHPSSTQAYHLRRGACLSRMGDEAGAARERAEAERLRPDGAFDHFLIGQERFKRGLLTGAKRHFEAAVRSQPDHFWAKCLSAICDLNARPPRPAEARAVLNDCLERHPDFAWLYLLRGFANGQIAEEEYHKALGLEPGAESSSEAAKSSFEAAEEDYQKALELEPGEELRYALLVNRGHVRFRRGKLPQAVADLREAIRLNPRQYNAYVTLAHIDWKQGRRDDAIRKLSRAIELKPKRPDTQTAALYRTRAHWHMDRKGRPAALRDLSEAVRYGPPTSQEAAKDHAMRGQLLYSDKRYEDALDDCDAALKIDPECVEAHRWRVATLLELKRYDDVLSSCNVYLSKGEPSADIYEVRGLARAHHKDYAGAIDDYTQALALRPDRSVLHAHRGWAHLVSDAPKLALRDFEEAIGLDSANGDAYSGRGSALVLLGQYQKAVDDAETSLHHGELTPRKLYNAARTYSQASAIVTAQVRRGGRPTPDLSYRFQDRALELLGQALGRLPAGRRASFWRDFVRADDALSAIRKRSRFGELAGQAAVPAP